MLENAVHIGHKRQYWSAKMRNYIFGIQNHIHVFDLYKTAERLEAVKAALADLSGKGKSILIVGTKIQSREIVREIATATGSYYIDNKWVPGLLTNFPTIKKRIAAYNKIEKDIEIGAFDSLTKKERAEKAKELDKLKKAYEGIKDMKRTPDAILIVDGYYEGLATAEAKTLKLPTYALLGSTGDIDTCHDFVPCNVNSVKSIKFVLEYLKPALVRVKKDFTPAHNGGTPRKPREEDAEESVATDETAAQQFLKLLLLEQLKDGNSYLFVNMEAPQTVFEEDKRPDKELRVLAAVCYIPLGFILPYFLQKNDEDFVIFHLRQAIAMFVVTLIASFLLGTFFWFLYLVLAGITAWKAYE